MKLENLSKLDFMYEKDIEKFAQEDAATYDADEREETEIIYGINNRADEKDDLVKLMFLTYLNMKTRWRKKVKIVFDPFYPGPGSSMTKLVK